MTAKEIQVAIARKYGLEPAQLRKGGRNGGKFDVIVKARDEAMATIRRELGFSYPMIGRIFGGFHHSTVMVAVANVGSDEVTFERSTTVSRLEALERKVAIIETALHSLMPEMFR